MNRSWMYGDRRERAFQKGVTEFCSAALEHQRLSKEPTIFCPCRDCCNVKRWTDINTIEDHLYRRGFRADYETWYWHGEKLDFGDGNSEAKSACVTQKKRAIGKECVKGNIHRHTLGQKSYSRKRVEWVKEKRLPPTSESSTAESGVVSDKLESRALKWCLAHQSRMHDGKWEVDPRKVETARVVSKVMELLEMEKKNGAASTLEPDNDALSKALGKRDYYGWVKGLGRCGVGVGHQRASRKVTRKNNRDEEIESLKATIARMDAMFQAQIASLSSSLNMIKNQQVVNPPLPQQQQQLTFIEAPCKCRLAVKDDNGNLIVVADGTYAGVIHNSILLSDHYRVSIDKPYDEHGSVDLPVPTADGVIKVGLAKGYYVNWPIPMVLFEDMNNQKKTPSQNKEGAGSYDPIKTQESHQDIVEHTQVGGYEPSYPLECRLLHELMIEEKHDAVRVPFKAPLLYFEIDQDVWVTTTDVEEFLRFSCLNVSVIHVYIRYLIEEFVSAFQGEYITFLCPHRISGAECERKFYDVVSYVKKAFIREVQKKDSHPCHLILAPYHENNHWILMAIDLRAGVIYQLDPLAPQQLVPLLCANILDIAYTSYRARKKEEVNFELVVKQLQCAQQTGGIECGYYVMKYMHEIVMSYSQSRGDYKQLEEWFTGRSASYSKNELDEVREQWAKYFRLKFLLS